MRNRRTEHEKEEVRALEPGSQSMGKERPRHGNDHITNTKGYMATINNNNKMPGITLL